MVEKTIDEYVKTHKELMEIVPKEQRGKAVELFQEGYEIHKKAFGSYALIKKDYHARMTERYAFAKDYAILRLGLNRVLN